MVRNGNDAVSPASGAIPMVASTVILDMVIPAFVFGTAWS
jgi:FlaG/FlaF family flagellin (archaellin)